MMRISPINSSRLPSIDLTVDRRTVDVYTRVLIMKKDIHPTNYRQVVFQDLNNGDTFITSSTVAAEETITLDGVEYPLVKVHISRTSHPFFTGEERIVDIEGRVDKFKARTAAAAEAREQRAAKAQKTAKRAATKAAKAADTLANAPSTKQAAKSAKK